MWRRYLRFWGSNPQADLIDEMEAHLVLRAEDLERSGLAPDEARAQARKEFGNLAKAERECRAIDREAGRRHRGWARLDRTTQDLRYAARLMSRSPGYAIVAVLTLAIGIGASTAIFSLVHGVLLQPLPYSQPEELVRIYEVSPRGDDHNVVSPGNFLDWRTRARDYVVLGAHRWPYGVSLTSEGDPRQLMVTDVTPSIFSILGITPAAGRTLTSEDAQGDRLVVVLSHRLWQQQFGSRADVIGHTLLLDDQGYRVVGVMPKGFDFPDGSVDAWRPIAEGSLDPTQRRSHNLGVIGRLKPGVSLGQVQADFSGIARGLAEEHPQFMSGWGVSVTPLHQDLVASVRPLLIVLLGGAVLVLVISCANLANLQLNRTVSRQREIGIRGALGAGTGRLVRQLFTESLLLAAAGGGLSIVVGKLLLLGLLTIASADIPRLNEVRLDINALGFAAAATVLSTLLFGALPSFRLARSDLPGVVRSGRDRSMTASGMRVRNSLLVAEMAFSLVLLTGAGLIVRTFGQLHRVDFGYDPAHLITMRLDLPRVRYDSTPDHLEFYRRLLERLERVPGVQLVAATTEPPPAATR